VPAYRRKGIPVKTTLTRFHEATANRSFGLLKRAGIVKDMITTQSIACNIGVVRRVERLAGIKALVNQGTLAYLCSGCYDFGKGEGFFEKCEGRR